MKKDLRLLIFTMLFLLFASNSGKAQNNADILVIGTIHNNHAVSNYTYNDVLSILDTYKPDLICVEIRPSDFRNATPPLHEMMLATLYGDLKGIKVEPIDWWDDKNNDRNIRDSLGKIDHYIQLLSKEDSLVNNDRDIQMFIKKYGGNIYNNTKLDLLFWNGIDYSNFIWHNYKISLDVFGDSPFNLHYIIRNRNMLHLINDAIAVHKSQRIIILTGGEHKRFFDDSLSVQKNVRLLSIENILPLNNYDNTKLLTNELPSLYYQKNVSEDEKEGFYSFASLPLVHGMGMDFNPSKITENSIKEYKFILDNWKRDIPNSGRLNYEFGWYNFLTGNYDTAVLFFNHYIEATESGRISLYTPLTKGIALSIIAKCYDLEGNRAMAIDYYNKSVHQLQIDKQDRLIDYIVTPYLKEPYKK